MDGTPNNLSRSVMQQRQLLQNSYTPTPASNVHSRMSHLDPLGNPRIGHGESQKSSGGISLDRPLSIK